MDLADALLLGGSAFGAGVMNAIAGGGTLLTFPALVAAGLPAIAANATSTVALLPASASSMAGYRAELRGHGAWLRALFLPSLIGGTAGSLLLLSTPEKVFARLAPWLVLFATALFLLQGLLAKRKSRLSAPTQSTVPPSPAASTASPSSGSRGSAGLAKATGSAEGAHPMEPSEAGPSPGALPRGPGGHPLWIAVLAQLGIALYGGYFGAGIGILMLALLGFLGLGDIHTMNGLKNFFNLCINLIAAGLFVAHGAVVWPAVLLMLPCSILGGYGGARLARSIGRERARVAVVAIGVAMAALLFWQQSR